MGADTTEVQRLPSFGAKARHPVDLTRFLPSMIQRLWAAIAIGRSLDVGSGHTLRTREWRVLMILAVYGPQTSVQIAEHTATDTATTARAVKCLMDLGFLEARTPKSDRRKQVLALTPAGAAAHDIVAPIRSKFSEEALSCLSPQEQEQLFTLLNRLLRHVHFMSRENEHWL